MSSKKNFDLDDGTNRLSQNVGKELRLYSV